MKTHSSVYKIILPLLALLMTPAGAGAQSIEVLGLAHGTTSANMKAEVDLQGKTIQNVIGRTFKMSDGSSTTCEDYKLFGDKYVIANFDYHPGNDYFYRLEITFTDGTTINTDCYNESFTEGAVWLSDLPITSNTTGPEPVGIDMCANGEPLQIHPTTLFYKGISAHSTGLVHYDLTNQPRNFTYVKFTMGMQAFKADGSNSTGFTRIIFMMNGAETGSRGNMPAYSKPGRGSIYHFDQTQTAAGGIKSVSLKLTDPDRNTTDDYANLAACRLYYKLPASEKQAQTVTFETPGGTIFKDSPRVDLSAYASGGTQVFFTLIQGGDIADIVDGHILVPRQGKSGEIVVEALTLGNAEYAPASSTQTFSFNFGPTVKYLYTHKHGEDNAAQSVYLYIDPQTKTLEKLNLVIYDNARSFQLIKGIDVLSKLTSLATPLENVYAVPVTAATDADIVYRLSYKFAGEDEVVGELGEGDDSFIYMSDKTATLRPGYGKVSIDNGYGTTGVLKNSKHTYGKGYGAHAAGYVETTFDLSPYDRFVVDVGGQIITNPTRGRLSFELYNGLTTPYLSTGNVGWAETFEWDFPLSATGAGKTVKLAFGAGGDGNTNDVVCIGAPRFYYIRPEVNTQTVEWKTEELINDYKPFVMPLTATASSRLPVLYRLVSGSEYARIKDNNSLEFYNIPQEAQVVVEAFQPGDKEYAHSNVCTCVFHIRKAFVVERDARVELEGGHDIDELIIYGDASSTGQAVVKDGLVNIRKLVLKYTFVPGEWNFISFPSDMDLTAVSDLNQKGYYFSPEEGVPGTFLLREYDTRRRAEYPDASPWIDLASSKVKGMKGYIMRLEDDTDDPVEITFTMNNMALDFDNSIRPLYLTLDMTECMPESRHTVYVRPSNVKGNALRVDIRFSPSDISELPVNHARALEEMRVTHTPVRGAIRLTLPDQTPARVAIFDLEGKHLLKAVRYVSPMKINISDLEPGTYRMVVIYGPASTERLVEL